MNYTVIARRYRPQTFEEIVGQTHIAETLRNAIKEGKVSHAYIFAGPRGVGKTSLARIFAKALNCIKGQTPTPCNSCEICLSISEGTDLDVIEMDAASNRGIDEIRSLRERISYLPMRARYKIYIIDEAHQLSRDAFNALLKTLEEPPPHVKFLFATTEPHKMPDTILSRCQRFNLRRITTQAIYQHLEYICQKEKVSADSKALSLIAQLSCGSMRDAQSMLEQSIAFTRGKITQVDLETLLGVFSLDEIFRLMDALSRADLTEIIQLIDTAFNQGKDMMVFFDQVIEHIWRLILVLNSPPDSPLLKQEIIQDQDRYFQQAKQFSSDTLLDYITYLIEAKQTLRETSNLRVAMELLFLKMAYFIKNKLELTKKNSLPQSLSLSPVSYLSSDNLKDFIAKKVPKAESKFSPPNTPIPDKIEIEPEINPLYTPQQLKELWPKIVEAVRQRSIKVYAVLCEGHFIRADNQEIVIGFTPTYNFHRTMLEDINYKRVVEECIQKVTGLSLPITLVKIQEPSSLSQEEEIVESKDTKISLLDESIRDDFDIRKKRLIEKLSNNPIIQQLIDEFDAQIVDVKEK